MWEAARVAAIVPLIERMRKQADAMFVNAEAHDLWYATQDDKERAMTIVRDKEKYGWAFPSVLALVREQCALEGKPVPDFATEAAEGFTTVAPTEPGYYWFYGLWGIINIPKALVEVRQVENDRGKGLAVFVMGDNRAPWLKDCRGSWQGPLT